MAKRSLLRRLGFGRPRRPEPVTLARPIRIGIFGAGKAATYHLETLQGIKGAEPVFIVNRGNARAAALAQRFGLPHAFANPATALDAAQIDAAIVAVPPQAIAPISRTLLDRGIPCLIEKPLGTSAHEAHALAEAASHVPGTCVGLNRRYLSCVRQAWELCRELPDIYAVHIEAPEPIDRRYRENRQTAENLRDWLLVNSIHAIDLFTLFAGPFSEVVSFEPDMPFRTRPFREDFATLVRFENGVVGSYVSHWHSPGEWRLDLFGKGFRLLVNLKANTLTVFDEDRRPSKVKTDPLDHFYKPGVYLQDLAFLEGVAQGRAPEGPMASPTDAALSMRLAEEMQGAGSVRPGSA